MENICGFVYPDRYGRTKEELRERAIELEPISNELASMGVRMHGGCNAGIVRVGPDYETLILMRQEESGMYD